ILSDPAPPIDAPLPEPLRWIIDRCLEKEPEQRYESTRDLYQELRNIREHWSETSASRAVAEARVPRKARRWPLWAAGAAVIVLAYVAGALFSPARQARLASYRFTDRGSNHAHRERWPSHRMVPRCASHFPALLQRSDGRLVGCRGRR